VLEILHKQSLDDHGKMMALRRLASPPQLTELKPIRFI
jgi:hypothetical protein